MAVAKYSHHSWRYPYRVVILGAGFAGLRVAQGLANTDLDVTLIDRQNHHTFQPLLHQVATAELEPSQVAYPIRSALRRAQNVEFVMAEALNIDTTLHRVETTVGRFHFDFLVVATGSKPRLEIVPGAAQHAFVLKGVGDAIAIHQHVLNCFEQALTAVSSTEQQGHLTIAIAGGGTTGVELAGALAEWIHHSLAKDYGQLNCHHIRLVLLHSGSELLPGFHPRLQRYTLRHLQKLGVEVHLQTRVSQITADDVHLQDGRQVPAKTVVWTAGVQANSPAQGQQDSTTRWSVLPTLQTAAHPSIYALGDVAADTLTPLPMVAAVAVQQGRTAAQNILRQARGQRPLPFQYQPMGKMAILSRHAAVAQLGRLTVTGFWAWLAWLGVHVALLRGLRHRFLTLFHWGLSYCFRERVSQVLWQPSPFEVPVSTQKF